MPPLTKYQPLNNQFLQNYKANAPSPGGTFKLGQPAASPVPPPVDNSIKSKYVAPTTTTVSTNKNGDSLGIDMVPLGANGKPDYTIDPTKPNQSNTNPQVTGSLTADQMKQNLVNAGYVQDSTGNWALKGSTPTDTTDTTKPADVTNPGLITRLSNQDINNDPTYQKALADYQKAGETNQVIGQAEADALHNPNFSLDTGIGRSGLIQQNYGLQGENALTQAQGELSAANTRQGLLQSALGSGVSATQPTSVAYGTRYGSPQDLAKNADNGQGGGGITAVANVQSITDGTTKLNNLDLYTPGLADNMTYAINLATQANINKDMPIVNAFSQAIAAGTATNDQYQSFQQKIGQVQDSYQKAGLDTGNINWQNLTVNQLQGLQSNLASDIANQKDSLNKGIAKLKSNLTGSGNSNNNNSTSSTFGGSAWN